MNNSLKKIFLGLLVHQKIMHYPNFSEMDKKTQCMANFTKTTWMDLTPFSQIQKV